MVRPTKPPADAYDTTGGGATPFRLGAAWLVIAYAGLPVGYPPPPPWGRERGVCAVWGRELTLVCGDWCEGVSKCRVSQHRLGVSIDVSS